MPGVLCDRIVPIRALMTLRMFPHVSERLGDINNTCVCVCVCELPWFGDEQAQCLAPEIHNFTTHCTLRA